MRIAMTRYSTAFEAEQVVPPEAAQKLVPSPSSASETAKPAT
jgi:hypothetical protein